MHLTPALIVINDCRMAYKSVSCILKLKNVVGIYYKYVTRYFSSARKIDES